MTAAHLLAKRRAAVAQREEMPAPYIEEDDSRTVPAPVLSPCALDGVLGQVVKVYAPHTEAHPAGLLLTLYAIVGAILGGGPHLMIEGARHAGNLFVMLIGATGTGRKTTTISRVKQFLALVVDSFLKTNLSGGLSTGEGLIHAVRDPQETELDATDQSRARFVDMGVADKRVVFIENEMGILFRRCLDKVNTLLSILRLAWDGGTLRTTTRRSPMCATDPHISIVGAIPGEELISLASDGDFSGGTLNRFLFGWTTRTQELPHHSDPAPEELIPLAETVRRGLQFAEGVGAMRWSDDAREWWAAEYHRLTTPPPGRLGAATQRSAPQVLRLAVTTALLDCRDTIRRSDLEIANAINQYSIDSLRYLLGDAPMSELARRMVDALRAAGPDGLSLTELRRSLGSNNISSDRINSALGELKKYGAAEAHKYRTGHRPKVIWVHADHAIAHRTIGNNGPFENSPLSETPISGDMSQTTQSSLVPKRASGLSALAAREKLSRCLRAMGDADEVQDPGQGFLLEDLTVAASIEEPLDDELTHLRSRLLLGEDIRPDARRLADALSNT
jgi:hypothetical protein